MFIDCHMHAFADKIAEKAVAQLINYYNIPTTFGGRFDDLLAAAKEAGLDGLILLVAATKPEQVKPAHDWMFSLLADYRMEKERLSPSSPFPKIIHFGTFHPDDPSWLSEIRRLRMAGIKGLKLHPEFQGFDLADPRLGPFFEEVENDFILMIHVGDPAVNQSNFSTPRKIAAILKNFPEIKIIAAHLGGLYFWDEVYEVLAGREVYFDTSSAIEYIDENLFRKIVAKHGPEKIFFGSDYPLRSPKQALEFLDRIKWLSTKEKEGILGLNCARLFPEFG